MKTGKVLVACSLSIAAFGAVVQSGCGPSSDPNFTIESVTPAAGSIYGGTKITIKGKGFEPGMRITVGKRDCIPAQIVSESEATCLTPMGATGPADIEAYTKGDKSVFELAGGYTYQCQSPLPEGMVVWASEGGDKVAQEELRASCDPQNVLSSVWDGTSVKLFGAKNEVVGFNLTIEAPKDGLNGVAVSFNSLTGPDGAKIESQPASDHDALYKWVDRKIELFYVRYLQIRGLSLLGYNIYDERHVPRRLRRPWSGEGIADKGTGWLDRGDHDKHYPDIAVPMELEPSFNVEGGKSQNVWVDIYVPKTVPAGDYVGEITVTTTNAPTKKVPVTLKVRKFELPDAPTAKTMLYFGYTDLSMRYYGQPYVDEDPVKGPGLDKIRDRHFLVAHRHKITMIDDNPGYTVWTQRRPREPYVGRFNGYIYRTEQGYDGPGVNVGNDIYSIGNYGNWSWQTQGEPEMWANTDQWENWFNTMFPNVERFLFLIDEPKPDEFYGSITEWQKVEQWSTWMSNNPGPGGKLNSFSTVPLPEALDQMPHLKVICSAMAQGDTETWEKASARAKAEGKKFWLYNGKRPGSGSFMTDDEGVALREVAWGQFKKGIERWFYWESTYYRDFQTGRGQNDLFNNALTFGLANETNPAITEIMGEAGFNHSNGDGVLFYPGTDKLFPADSYDLEGPIASLRLKYWRRGIQDVDYLAMARAIDPVKTDAIVNRIIPKVLWENGLTDKNDPNYVRTDVSWSWNPDDWEKARAELADIIESAK